MSSTNVVPINVGPDPTLNLTDPATWAAIISVVLSLIVVAWPGYDVTPLAQFLAGLQGTIIPLVIIAIKHFYAAKVIAAHAQSGLVPRSTIPLVPSPNDPIGGSVEPNTPIVASPGNNPGNVIAPGGTTPLSGQFVPGNVIAPGGSIPLQQGFAGSSADQLTAPAIAHIIVASGTLGSTTVQTIYSYRLVTTNALGQTGPGPASIIVFPAGSNTLGATLAWTPDPNGTGTKVYGNLTGQEQLMAILGSGVGTWTDNGSVTPSGALPAVNTTGTPQVGLQGAVGGFGNVVAPGGSVPTQQGAWPIPGGGGGSAGQYTATEKPKQ